MNIRAWLCKKLGICTGGGTCRNGWFTCHTCGWKDKYSKIDPTDI